MQTTVRVYVTLAQLRADRAEATDDTRQLIARMAEPGPQLMPADWADLTDSVHDTVATARALEAAERQDASRNQRRRPR